MPRGSGLKLKFVRSSSENKNAFSQVKLALEYFDASIVHSAEPLAVKINVH